MVYPLQYAEFPATSSNTNISETKDVFWIFYCISGMCIKFRTILKKDEHPTLVISEIVDSERVGYLNV